MATATIKLTQKSASILNLLKQDGGNSLTITRISQMTGMSVQEVKAEVKRLVYNGSGVCHHKGEVFLSKQKGFPTYVVIVAVLFATVGYIVLNQYFS